MGIIEKWNNFARKKIYINHSLQISAGRFALTFLITLIEAIGIIVTTGLIAPIFVLFSNTLLSLSKREEIVSSLPPELAEKINEIMEDYYKKEDNQE